MTNEKNAQAYFDAVVDDMKDLYRDEGGISDAEAREAAQNLIGLCRTLLKIKCKQNAKL